MMRGTVAEDGTGGQRWKSWMREIRLIELKSKSRSFRLTQIISFVLMLFLLVTGSVSGYDGLIGMGVGLAFSFAISMFAEVFTYMYYESKN